jgi:TRAP-type C4-dicarboxylate transport system permease small subunit
VTPLQSLDVRLRAKRSAVDPSGARSNEALVVVLDRAIGVIAASGLVLVLPLSLLLFLQWPLRDLVQGYSREANDLAQWLFALYVSLAITCATRSRSHLAADAFARRYPIEKRERLYRCASLWS